MNWTQTMNGTKWSLTDPRANNVNFYEIARALSVLPRFNGHTNHPTNRVYSVAEHSVRVHDLMAQWGEPDYACFWGLLHDAHEAYIGDITTPVKAALIGLSEEAREGAGAAVRNALRELAVRHDKAIFDAAGLAPKLLNQSATEIKRVAARVKHADTHLLVAEKEAFVTRDPWPGFDLSPDVELSGPPWVPAVAENAFTMALTAYCYLGRDGRNVEAVRA